MRKLKLAMLGTLCGIGCKDAPNQDTKRAPEQPAPASPRTDKPLVGDTKPAAAGKQAWALKLEGKRELAGPAVTMSKAREVAMYSLLGGDAMTTINVADGTSDAYAVQIGLPDVSEMCMYRADNKQQSKGLAVTLAGDRYEVDGEITCGSVKDSSAPKTVHKLTGYFEKK